MFVTKSDLDMYSNANYTKLSYLPAVSETEEIFLVFTKTESDALPVMSTAVE